MRLEDVERIEAVVWKVFGLASPEEVSLVWVERAWATSNIHVYIPTPGADGRIMGIWRLDGPMAIMLLKARFADVLVKILEESLLDRPPVGFIGLEEHPGLLMDALGRQLVADAGLQWSDGADGAFREYLRRRHGEYDGDMPQLTVGDRVERGRILRRFVVKLMQDASMREKRQGLGTRIRRAVKALRGCPFEGFDEWPPRPTPGLEVGTDVAERMAKRAAKARVEWADAAGDPHAK